MNQEATRIRITESTDARNARLNREALRAAPARILNQAQAEAVYSAMCALNNIGATPLEIDARDFVVKCVGDSVIVRGGENEREFYLNQDAFRTAYSLQ